MSRTCLLCVAALACLHLPAPAKFRVHPYLQNPRPDGVTVAWLSDSAEPGKVTCYSGKRAVFSATVPGQAAPVLAYSPWETRQYFAQGAPAAPFQHEVRCSGLQAGQHYGYEVEQDGQTYRGEFDTAPDKDTAIRFIAYSDSETEPESTGARVLWSDPNDPRDEKRRYLIDQTDGYAANLAVIRERKPNFIIIPGDLVENGGEQRDWDEFWKHNTHPQGASSTAGRIPLLAVVGNHDYYGGPGHGGFAPPASENAVSKYLAYFRPPSNGAADPRHHGRYYRSDYGPVTMIAIDSCNGKPHLSAQDSNHYLEAGSNAPDFNPGSEQYAWLEKQLAEAQQQSRFTFVAFHHCPYSSGLHCAPPGLNKPVEDPQSGRPLRILTPLFHRYGVDALLCGHDEMVERSEVQGEEVLPGGKTRPHTLQVYDVGVGGDGLRGSVKEAPNPYVKFMAHRDSQEVWEDGVLLDGGKHYGHLEIDVQPDEGRWTARCVFVYVFPVMDKNGNVLRFERRVYPDKVVIEQ